MSENSAFQEAFGKALEQHNVNLDEDDSQTTTTETPEPDTESTESPSEVSTPSNDEQSVPSGEESSTPAVDAKSAKGDAPSTAKDTQTKAPVSESADEPPPEFWKPEHKSLWAKVPPELKPILKNYEKGRNQLAAHLKNVANEKIGQWVGAKFEDIFPAERVRALKMEGKTPASATEALWTWHDYLEENPHEAISEIMDRYELTPEQLHAYRMVNPQQQNFQQAPDPQIQELVQWKQQEQQRVERLKIKAALDAFGNQAGADGRPIRPHWGEVKKEMKYILPLVYEQNPGITDAEALHQAYERAVYASPSVRAKLASSSQNQVKFTPEKTLRAKEAASSLSGSSSRTVEPPKTKPKTARDALNMAWAKHTPR